MTDPRELAQQVIAKGELATAGEWKSWMIPVDNGIGGSTNVSVIHHGPFGDWPLCEVGSPNHIYDADFIAFTRSAAPTLALELIKALDENERLRRDVEVWMRQFNKARDEVVGLRRIAGGAIESGDHGGGIAETTVARLRSELATVADLYLELHKESE